MSNTRFLEALGGEKEIAITVKGRRTGRRYTTPVSFGVDAGKVYLLPTRGSNNNWYRNILVNPAMRVKVGNRTFDVRAKALTDRASVERVMDLIAAKSGKDYLERWYSVFDAAVEVAP